jgi:NitT/TauT family transport system ATP-binding protein
MPGDSALSVAIAGKSFGTHAVLADIRFEAGPGEVLALFGPSGTGKTTTLRIALGLDPTFKGQVQLPSGPVGVMFQEPRLLPWLTLAENLRLVSVDTGSADVPTLLTTVGLPGAEKKRPKELSLGMARRAALARALAVNPALLVLDEPFASLDPQLAATLASVIADRARHHRTIVLFATHDLDQALAVADRILVLYGHPARLAADERVPPGAAATALREQLMRRFPFLGAPDSK